MTRVIVPRLSTEKIESEDEEIELDDDDIEILRDDSATGNRKFPRAKTRRDLDPSASDESDDSWYRDLLKNRETYRAFSLQFFQEVLQREC